MREYSDTYVSYRICKYYITYINKQTIITDDFGFVFIFYGKYKRNCDHMSRKELRTQSVKGFSDTGNFILSNISIDNNLLL